MPRRGHRHGVARERGASRDSAASAIDPLSPGTWGVMRGGTLRELEGHRGPLLFRHFPVVDGSAPPLLGVESAGVDPPVFGLAG